ncbi:MAG: DUF5611 family protein [Thermoplasmata archaeon]|nr:DUF5611 family protein [Thermoplasmata archaeon]
MQDYNIKRGHGAKVEGSGLEGIVRDIFGNANIDTEGFVRTSYGALRELRARVGSPGVLQVETRMDPGVDDETAMSTIALYNRFLLEATGYTTKERKKKAQKG